MRLSARIALIGTTLAVAGFGALLVYGPERVWERFVPIDLGPVDFASLQRSVSPNDALAATPGTVPVGLPIDTVLPIYARSVQELLNAIDERAANDGARIVASGANMRRYVTYSPTLRFPDTTVVEAVRLDVGTGVRAYARASLGYADMGANQKRLERWLGTLERSK